MAKKRTTMNISLSPQLGKYVEKLVESGNYQSASEVVREGLRLVRERQDGLAEIRRKVDEGRRDFEAGRVRSAQEVMGEWARLDRAALRRVTRRRKSA